MRFGLPLDNHNTTSAAGDVPGTVDVAHQPGAPRSAVRDLRVDVSYDEGKTWRKAKVERNGKQWRVRIPAGGTAGGFASLRATANDAAGNAVTETITRASALS